MRSKTALFVLSLLLLVIIALLYINLKIFPNLSSPSKTTAGSGCPFAVKEYCRQRSMIGGQGKNKVCYPASLRGKIVSPLSGEVNYGKISLGSQPGEGPFYERLLISEVDGEGSVLLIFAGEAKKGLHFVDKGDTVGEVSGELALGEERCSLVVEGAE